MQSRKRLIGTLRQLLRLARGRSVRQTIELLNPVLHGWAANFKLALSPTALQAIDAWVRRRYGALYGGSGSSLATANATHGGLDSRSIVRVNRR